MAHLLRAHPFGCVSCLFCTDHVNEEVAVLAKLPMSIQVHTNNLGVSTDGTHLHLIATIRHDNNVIIRSILIEYLHTGESKHLYGIGSQHD